MRGGLNLLDGDQKIYLLFLKGNEIFNQEFYGWTLYKKAVKTFLQQRKRSKYFATTSTYDELKQMEQKLETDISYYMLDTISLLSQSGHHVILLTTKRELLYFEKDLMLRLKDYASMDNVDHGYDIDVYVNMYIHLLDSFQNSLQIIGYYPNELDEMLGMEEDDARAYLDSVYDDISSLDYHTKLDMVLAKRPLSSGLHSQYRLLSKIIYSAEAFIKILKDRM